MAQPNREAAALTWQVLGCRLEDSGKVMHKEEPELAAPTILQHIAVRWVMGCGCLVCQRVDFRKCHIAATTLHELPPRPPGGFRAALRAHRREQGQPFSVESVHRVD
jgi:hypothetical protein